MIGGRVLDTSALTDAATGRSIYARALIRTAVDAGIVLAVPAAALLEAWASVPAEGRPFLGLLLDLPEVVLEPVDARAAEEAGMVLAGRFPSAGRVFPGAAHAAVVARRRDWPVVTGQPGILRSLADDIELEPLP